MQQQIQDQSGIQDQFEYDSEGYEPNEEEIIGYAEFLGMNINEDADLLFIAETGLSAPVPKPWKAVQDKQGNISYKNLVTNEINHDHPLDDFYRNLFVQAKQLKEQGLDPRQVLSQEPSFEGVSAADTSGVNKSQNIG